MVHHVVTVPWQRAEPAPTSTAEAKESDIYADHHEKLNKASVQREFLPLTACFCPEAKVCFEKASAVI